MNARFATFLIAAGIAAGQAHQPTPLPRQQPQEDSGAVDRGRTLFKSTCGFCHGEDATGSRAPDLVRSATLLHDDNGNLLGPTIRNGRPDKGMPSFATMKDDEISAIVAFLHHQANVALHSNRVNTDYPLSKLLTGDAPAGKAYFNGEGGCSGCHSATGDLAGVAKKYTPLELQQQMVYPASKNVQVTATVTLKDGTRYHGSVAKQDEFTIALVGDDGWYRSFSLDDAKVVVKDPFQAHRELMSKYTDADLHNLFAYLETLK